MSTRWISVEENHKLPDLAKKVLVSDGTRVFQAERQPCSSKDLEGAWYWWDNYYHEPNSVTHWQPLPEPPVRNKHGD